MEGEFLSYLCYAGYDALLLRVITLCAFWPAFLNVQLSDTQARELMEMVEKGEQPRFSHIQLLTETNAL